MSRAGILGMSGLLVLVLLPLIAGAAPITFSTALPVAKGEGIFRVQLRHLTASDSGSLNRELDVWAAPVVGAYGLTGRWALFAAVPYLDKELEVDTALDRRTRGVSGLGDAVLLARYTLLQQDRPGRTFRVAPFFGVESPTGTDDESDALGRLPQPLQLGSGSWDPLTGVVSTWQSLERQVDAALSYKLNTTANDFEFGDIARFDLSWQHRVWPRQLGPGVPAFVYGVLEGNLVWQDRNEIAGVEDPDSGGTVLYLTPGVQWVTKRTVLESAVQIPLIENLHGNALANDYVVILSFRVNF